VRTYPLCIPCLVSQGLNAIRGLNIGREKEMEIALRSVEYLAGIPEFEKPPAYYASFIQRIVRDVSRSEDPFKEQKKLANTVALRMLPLLEKQLENSEDRLSSALRISAVGNYIDFAIRGELDPEEDIRSILNADFAVWDYRIFQKRLRESRSLLIIGDNAGEIVLDKPLVKVLRNMGKEVFYAVKGEPILNDVTLEDAEEISMKELCKVVSNGSGMVGTWLEDCSPEFRELFYEVDLVISKGQANFETLDTSGREIFFLLVAKCEPVALETSSEPGRFVFLRKAP